MMKEQTKTRAAAGGTTLRRAVCGIWALCLLLAVCVGGTGCAVSLGNSAETLPAPTVTVSETGLASWEAVEGAAGYCYRIDDGEPVSTEECSLQLTLGQSVRVMAKGDGVRWADSPYSGAVSFTEAGASPLLPPEVQVDGEGLATWAAVPGATGYRYRINSGVPNYTEERSVRLSNGQFIQVQSVGDGEAYSDSLYGDAVWYRTNALATPAVSIDNTGLATWAAVPGAVGYRYTVDGGEEQETAACAVQLTDGQTICVQAVGDGDGYRDSAYSAPRTYYSDGCSHTDTDDDGLCDGCGISVVIVLNFYAINDLHGKYMDTDQQPGVDEFTTYMKELYADSTAYEILLSSGDMWQGTVESSSNRGALMTDWMNEVGFVSMTLGNHEYDWGGDGIAHNGAAADFPFLAINIRYNGKPVDYCRPSVVVERGGVRVGIIGAMGDCLSSISGEYTDGLSFVTGSDLTALVKAEATRLRTEESCDFIVYSIHGGYGSSSSGVQNVDADDISSYYDVSLSDGYVDLVFEGHTHQSYILRDPYGVYHLQGGGENRSASYASVTFHLVSGQAAVGQAAQISSSVYGAPSIADDPAVEDIFRRYFPTDNPYTTVVGKNSAYRSSDDITEQVAQLYWEIGQEIWGDRYQVVLGGGYLKTRSPYNLPAGNVTYAQLFSLLPFDNAIVLGSIRGSDLRSKFIESDNSAYHCAYDPAFAASIDSSATYYIVVDSYTSSYAPNRITEVARWEEKTYARDLLCAFIARGGWGAAAAGAAEAYASATARSAAQALMPAFSPAAGRQPAGYALLPCAQPTFRNVPGTVGGRACVRRGCSTAARAA